MTLRPRLSFTVTILIAFTLVFALGVGLAIFGFRSAGERAAVATGSGGMSMVVERAYQRQTGAPAL